MSGVPVPLTSPWVFTATDYLGRAITATVAFNNSTLALQSCTVTRAAGCLYQHVYFGLGTDGTPNSTIRQFGPVPTGQTTENAAALSALGFNTITDVLAGQVTAGP